MLRIERSLGKIAHYAASTRLAAQYGALAIALALPGTASIMSFSVYNVTTLSSDALTVYNGTTIQDQSSGCSHSNYVTYSEIENADGTWGDGSADGLVANTSMPIDGVSGIWTVAGAVTYYCSCIQNTAGAGGSATVPLQHIEAYYYYTGQANQGNGVYKRCTPINSTCDNCVIQIGSPAVQYGLFTGAEMHVAGTAWCFMTLEDQTSRCYSPDPVPGEGGGVWVRRRGASGSGILAASAAPPTSHARQAMAMAR